MGWRVRSGICCEVCWRERDGGRVEAIYECLCSISDVSVNSYPSLPRYLLPTTNCIDHRTHSKGYVRTGKNTIKVNRPKGPYQLVEYIGDTTFSNLFTHIHTHTHTQSIIFHTPLYRVRYVLIPLSSRLASMSNKVRTTYLIYRRLNNNRSQRACL